MAKFILSEIAEEDVDLIHAYITVDNPEAADRVLEAIIESFGLLAQNPELGRLRVFRRWRNIRSWVVTKFNNYVVFYRALPNGSGIEIIRVLHGARNLDAMFQERLPK